MIISIITLFPAVFNPFLSTSIIGRASKKGLTNFNLINLRDFGYGPHQIVDGRPFGGGAGMILKADILAKALKFTIDNAKLTKNNTVRVILTSASGKLYKQKEALEFSELDHLIIICGHYEGVDQRFIDKYVDLEISIGDYVLTGGEIPAMVIIDSVTRLLPGVLKKPEAILNESFSKFQFPDSSLQLLEYPQYTKPEDFEGQKVPQVLRSGHHQKIKQWQKEQALEKTKKVRPDLLK